MLKNYCFCDNDKKNFNVYQDFINNNNNPHEQDIGYINICLTENV